jgi:hypothetical protein
MTSGTYISVVVVGRNDDYGVNFLSRLQTFMRSLDWQCRDYHNLFELVIVEWNPLQDRPGLAEVLPRTQHLPVRFITVDPKIHDELGSTIPVLEMMAKNTGIRRCHGEFALVTNPDVIFTSELIDYLAQRRLDVGCFYRTDRYDFDATGIEYYQPWDFTKFAVSKTKKAHCMRVSYQVESPLTIWDLPRTSPVRGSLHANASGDFLLAHRRAFDATGGLYVDLDHRWHNDSYSVVRLNWSGFRQQCLTAPLCVFHQDHETSTPDVEWSAETALKLGSSKGPEDWGLQGLELKETFLN